MVRQPRIHNADQPAGKKYPADLPTTTRRGIRANIAECEGWVWVDKAGKEMGDTIEKGNAVSVALLAAVYDGQLEGYLDPSGRMFIRRCEFEAMLAVDLLKKGNF